MVLARNTISGQISDVSPKMLEHPAFKAVLEVVSETAKPYIPEMYVPGTKTEKASKRKKADEAVTEEVVVEETIETSEVIEEQETITYTEEEN